MSVTSPTPIVLPASAARAHWLSAQRLDTVAPFGTGAEATRLAIEHLGYVQIDTINVIERCHHHILWSRIPDYRREHLHQAQTIDKHVFEYWTHALAYVPTRDLRFFLPAMRQHRLTPKTWFSTVTEQDLRKVMTLIRKEGPLSIRDIDDDVLVDKDHAWASRKPSKRALHLAFFHGDLTVSERVGMVKTYDLIERHFGWTQKPRPAGQRQVIDYLIDRALRAQRLVSLDSICHLDAGRKPAVRAELEARQRKGLLVAVRIAGDDKTSYWAAPEQLEAPPVIDGDVVHILSPFDPLIIQRKRLKQVFDYDHLFEAYLPKERRRFGYFGLPVLVGDEVVAVIDLKTDRAAGELRIQQWTWLDRGSKSRHKAKIDAALHRFERFQLPS